MDEFRENYWAARADYDRGDAAADYWHNVVGRPVTGTELVTLRRLDLEGWTHLDFDTITVLKEAHRRGARLTLLSNAPHDLADEVARFPALAGMFSLLLFSAQLGMIKPAESIYTTALALTETTPDETLFIDDRVENLTAAAALGIRTHQFTSAANLHSELEDIGLGSIGVSQDDNRLEQRSRWFRRHSTAALTRKDPT